MLVRETVVPSSNFAEQLEGQLIPLGLLVTLPWPETLTVSFTWVALNAAETDSFAERTTWQLLPLHAPPKPPKVNPEPALAVSVTEVPLSNPAVQVEGQLIPAGLLVTLPVPLTETVSWAC